MDYKKVVATANEYIGYQGGSKNSVFSEFMDSISWYNYPKSNSCSWCAIFADFCFAKNAGELSYEQVRQIVCEPVNSKNNCGAGATQHAQYFKDAGRWISSVKDATTGDFCFFKRSNGQIYHVGLLIDFDSRGIYTAEGSTTYDGKPHSVGKKFYSYSECKSKFAGFGRPDWYRFDKAETPKEEPKEDTKPVEPTLAPTPSPAPSKPSSKVMRVIAKSGLNVRKGAGKSYAKLYALNYGASVTVYEQKDGWGRIGDGKWVCMDYLK